MPVLYAVTRASGSDEVAGLQREKQASNPILWKFSRVKSYTNAFFVPFAFGISTNRIYFCFSLGTGKRTGEKM